MPCESLYQGRRLDECAIKCHCEPTVLMSCIVLQEGIETVTITVIKLIVFIFYDLFILPNKLNCVMML